MQTISNSPSLEWQLSNGIVSNRVIRKWEFNIQVIKWLDGKKNKTFDKILLYPIESGNYIELRKKGKGYVGYIIELKNLLNIKIIEQVSGIIIKRQDLILEITFVDNSSASITKRKHTVMIDVEEKYAQEIIALVKRFKEIEQGYWKKSRITYRSSKDRQKTSEIFLEAPFFAESERIKWIWRISEREDKRRIIVYLRALTNFRVFEYNYKFHTGRAMALKNIGDVSVTIRDDNKDISKNETQFGIFTDIKNTIEVNVKNTTKIKSIGDVTFIANNEPFATFRSMGNPEDVARIVEKEKENILSFETPAQRIVMTYDLKEKDPFDIVSILGESICVLCHKELGFMRYTPKKEWHMNGQLCGECFGNPTRLGIKQISSEEDSQYACYMCRRNIFSLEF